MTGSVERILIALDPSPASLAACRLAVELAATLRAELVGIFVEDTQLLRSAELPVTREIGVVTGNLRRFEVSDLEDQLRVHARRTRDLFELVAGRTEVTTSFRITRTRAAPKHLRTQRRRVVRAVIEDLETAAEVKAAAAALASRLGLSVCSLAVGDKPADAPSDVEWIGDIDLLESRLRRDDGPIVVAASSVLAPDHERLARLSSESSSIIAVVR